MWHERAQLRETARLFFVFILSVGSMIIMFGLSYYLIGFYKGAPLGLIQCFYFVWITFASIGYSDEGFTSSGFRVMTILVGSFLIVRFIVLAAHVYARVVVEEVYNLRIMREMKKSLQVAQGHFLIFGDETELINKIVQGLVQGREVYLISEDRKLLQDYKEQYKTMKYIIAKPTKAETIDLLRPEAANCAYLLFREDEKNVLLAAMLEKRIRVISSFSGNFTFLPRFKRVGVVPISPHFSGGLKIVSTMIRPQVTEFLDRFLFPDNAELEFLTVPLGEAQRREHFVSLAAIVEGKMDFSAAPREKGMVMGIGYKKNAAEVKRIGLLESVELPIRTDRFLVIGGGTIGGTVIAELQATKRKLIVIDTEEGKIENLRQKYGEENTQYIVGDALTVDLKVDEFDGVAICTPVDEKNFTIGLDFIGSHLLRVVRAVDEDMEHHYRRIGAIPVYVGRVGSARMLREVTNQLANEVLRDMLLQQFRMDQVYIIKPGSLAELKARFPVSAIAYCRDRHCYFAPGEDEMLERGDTLLFCGPVDTNQALRLHHSPAA